MRAIRASFVGDLRAIPDHGVRAREHTSGLIPGWSSTPVLLARSSDQTDSTGKPTSDVVEDFRAAVRNFEDIFVTITIEHHVSRTQIEGLKDCQSLRSNRSTL